MTGRVAAVTRRLWPQPTWPTGTPLEIPWGWQIEHYCVLCFKGLCEYCTGDRGDGSLCHCWHDDDWEPVE